jgi:heparanase
VGASIEDRRDLRKNTQALERRKQMKVYPLAIGAVAVLGVGASFARAPVSPAPSIAAATMPRIGTVDERFQSYNIEMVEVTGGRFWKPYASKAEEKQSNANQPSGMDPSLYEYRPPIDLSNPRLRKLAAALGPAYLRVSGTWANTTYFQNSDEPAPAAPPTGFKAVLTRQQWKGVVDFSRAANAEIVTSFAISAGTRDKNGVWTPDQAQQILAYTKAIGGSIAASEFMNEPNFAVIGGAPKGYDAAAFSRDVTVFRAFAKQAAPDMLILGPGGVGEGSALAPPSMTTISSESILAATGPVFDLFSYHSYGAVSSRCAAMGASGTTSAEAALTEEWLARPARIEMFYAALRDRYEPGKGIWLTETAQAACGGDRWASTFLDSFRYLDQLGSLAKRGVQVQMHNTLAASDYGLLDEKTYEPRPNYWAALLWRKLMGTTVLDPGPSPSPSLHLYAQCLRDHPGGVALLVINADRAAGASLATPIASERYTLSAADLTSKQIQLNGKDLKLGTDDALPALPGAKTQSGIVTFPPASITFLAMPAAGNASCQ